jgi:hypothetical protein
MGAPRVSHSASWHEPVCLQPSAISTRRHTEGKLEQSAFGEAGRSYSRDDEVIEGLAVNQRQRLLERLRQKLVGATRFGDARGMLGCLRECHLSSVSVSGGLDS